MEHHLEISILNDPQTFAALENEWEDLYYDSPLATPFQSWSWLYSWWETFGEGCELRLITVRDKRLLVGVIPLMLERRWGFCTLRFIGNPKDQSDLLAKKGWEDRVSEAGIQAFMQMDSWHIINLKDVSPTAAAWGFYRHWNGRKAYTLANSYTFIEVKVWDEVLAHLSRKQRSTVRRTLRRGEEDGVRSVLVRSAEAERAARRLVALHQGMLHGRYIVPDRLTPEFEAFIVAVARRMTKRGLGTISELWRDGEVIMSSFTLLGGLIDDAYLVGVTQEARQRYQWSSLGIFDMLNMARNRNSEYVCLAQGEDPYKQRWRPKNVPYYQIVLSRGLVPWSVYLTYLSLRNKGAKYIKEYSTPTLVKNALAWLRSR